MEGALLGTLIPFSYLAVAGAVFSYSMRVFNRYIPEPKGYHTRETSDAFLASLCASFWPVAIWYVSAWARVKANGATPDLSRKQRRQIEFDRLQLKLAQDQADWLERVNASNLSKLL